jgi:hypothetical protein
VAAVATTKACEMGALLVVVRRPPPPPLPDWGLLVIQLGTNGRALLRRR